MKIQFLGFFDNKFNYRVELNGHSFDYFTGIGHCYTGTSKFKLKPEDIPVTDKGTEQFLLKKAFYKQHSLKFNERIYIQFPEVEDVLECLKLDAECGSMSFSEFCDNFGYSNDSISALNVYRACEETAKKLRGFKFETKEVQ